VNVPLYLLLSGDAFFLGLGLTVAGASCTPWASRLARGLVWGGSALAVLSAVPVHAAGYVALLASVVLWQVAQAGTARFRRASIQRQVCREYGVKLIPRSMLAAALTRPGHTSDGLQAHDGALS